MIETKPFPTFAMSLTLKTTHGACEWLRMHKRSKPSSVSSRQTSAKIIMIYASLTKQVMNDSEPPLTTLTGELVMKEFYHPRSLSVPVPDAI